MRLKEDALAGDVFWRRKDDTHPRCVQVFLVVKEVSVTATRMSTTRRCQKRAAAREHSGRRQGGSCRGSVVLAKVFARGFRLLGNCAANNENNPHSRRGRGLWTKRVTSAKYAACE